MNAEIQKILCCIFVLLPKDFSHPFVRLLDLAKRAHQIEDFKLGGWAEKIRGHDLSTTAWSTIQLESQSAPRPSK
jgi:hypothetical protein